MRPLALLLLLILLSAAVNAQNETNAPLAGTPFEARRAALEFAANRELTDMDAAIAVANEKNLDSSELSRLRSTFDEQRATISAATGTGQLIAIEDLLQNIAKDFLTASKAAGLRAYGEAVKARAASLEETRANESDHFREQAIEARTIALLHSFDQHVEIVRKAIDASGNASMNATQTALDSFISLKPALVSAINSRDKQQIQDVSKRLKDSWRAIRDAFTEAHLGDRIQRSIDRGESIAASADSNMRKLRTSGISVGALEKRLATFRAYLAKAREAANTGNYLEAQDQLKLAQAELDQLRTTYDQTRMGTLKKAAGVGT